MPAATSINLFGLEKPLDIVAAVKGQSRSAYLRDLVARAIELETRDNAALAALLEAA